MKDRKALYWLSVYPRVSLRRGFTVGQFTSLSTLSFSFFSFSPSSFWFRHFLALYSWLYTGLGFHFHDTCPIKALLAGLHTEVFSCVATIQGRFPINVASQVVAMHLMRRGGLLCPSFFFSFLFNAKLPDPFPPLGSAVLPLTLILDLLRLGKCLRCTRQLWLLSLSMS